MIVRKSKAELEAMREGGSITAACLKMLEESVRRVVSAHVLAHAPGAPTVALHAAPDPRALRHT